MLIVGKQIDRHPAPRYVSPMTVTIRQTTTMKYGLRMEKRDISAPSGGRGRGDDRRRDEVTGLNWARLPTTTRSPSRDPRHDLRETADSSPSVTVRAVDAVVGADDQDSGRRRRAVDRLDRHDERVLGVASTSDASAYMPGTSSSLGFGTSHLDVHRARVGVQPIGETRDRARKRLVKRAARSASTDVRRASARPPTRAPGSPDAACEFCDSLTSGIVCVCDEVPA